MDWGLSIVRRLVKLLDLKLEVRSELGKGSTFALELPSARTDVRAAGAVVEPRLPPTPRKTAAPLVLLVEDDPAVRDATRLLLKVEGYRVLTAGTLGEARGRAMEHRDIGLLVTDYHLSNNETGAQVIAELRQVVGHGINTVLVTGDTSSAVRALEHDQSLRLASKPIKADELLDLLKSLVAT